MSVLALLPWMQIANWTTFGFAVGTIAVVLAALWATMRRQQSNPYLNLVAGLLVALAFSRVVGPFVLMPTVIVGSVLAISANPRLLARPILVGAWALVALLAPIALEALGIFHETWEMVPGGVRSTSAIFEGISKVDGSMLVVANAVLLVAVSAYAIRVNRTSSEARHDLHVQAWHLNQLLPGDRPRIAMATSGT